MTELVIATGRVVVQNRALLILLLGSLLMLVGATFGFRAAIHEFENALTGVSPLTAGLLASMGTALATGLGALPVLFTRRISAVTQTTMVGFAAGIMLAATVFSLILPAIEAGTISSGSRMGGALITAVALLGGAALLLAVEHWIPHELLARDNRPVQNPEIRRVWLFVFVMTLHNLPEGLVVGVTFAGENTATALPLAIGIGMQNVPEGLAVALAMLSLNYSPHQAAWVALATGLVEPVGALIGAGAIVMSAGMVPWALAFAAGAMLFVITHEIIPQSHKNGRETSATVALFGGFVIMMLFDTVLA